MPSDRDSASARVLAVISDARLRDTLDRGLTRHGFGVTFAESPESVRAQLGGADASEFDVLLFDVQPGVGPRILTVVGQLRASGYTVPAACLISASLGASFPAREAGVELVLIKPIDLAELATELNRLAHPPRRAVAGA